MLENKWKRFAVLQTLSDWDDNLTADDLYDLIMLQDREGLCKVFDDHEVIVWQPFEDWTLADIAEHMQSLAMSAQNTSYEN